MTHTDKLPIAPLLQSGDFTAYYTLRGECNPDSPYDGFNLCHYTGDNPEHISDCLHRLSRWLGTSPDNIIIPRQTHSTNVLAITELPISDNRPENVDALVTNLKGIVIGVNTADCVPVVLIDPEAGITGVAHAGWRGAVAGIVGSTITEMIRLGAETAHIKAAMGPSIGIDCFEVGEETAQYFTPDCISRQPGQKPHVSLHRHITNSLISLGVKPENIQPFDPRLCTRCHHDRYWSARKMGISSGRIFTFVTTNKKI